MPFCFFHCNHSGEYLLLLCNFYLYFISLITNEIEHWLSYFVKYLFTFLAHMSKFFLCCGSVKSCILNNFCHFVLSFHSFKGLFWTLLFNFVLSIWNWFFSFFFVWWEGGDPITLMLFEINLCVGILIITVYYLAKFGIWFKGMVKILNDSFYVDWLYYWMWRLIRNIDENLNVYEIKSLHFLVETFLKCRVKVMFIEHLYPRD